MNVFLYDAELAEKQERMAQTRDMVRQRAEVMRALAPKANEVILELGSGNGIFTRDVCEAVGPDGKVVGLDSSEAMLSMAGHICSDGEFVLGDAQDLPFEDASFDAVVAAQLFSFLDDGDRALSEVFRVLKPQGRVVILDTDWDSLIWRSGNPELMTRVMEAYTAGYADAHLPRSLPQRLSNAGFSNTDADGFVVLNTSFGEDTYSGQSAGFVLSNMEESPKFSAAERKSWLDDLETLDQAGGYFFSLNRYIFSAIK